MLSESNLYFCAYYFLVDFHGTYKASSIEHTNILKHCLRRILGIKSPSVELKIINILKNNNKQGVIFQAKFFFEELNKNVNNNERTIFIRDKITEIRNLNTGLIRELEIQDAPEKNLKDALEEPENLFDKYEALTGKRFKMKKEQKERGLNRKEAIEERLKELKNGK